MAKDRDARTRKGSEVRPKAIRRELVDVEVELERARRRRDKAQARVEALEAIAEQLSNALVAAERTRDERRTKETDAPRSPEPAVEDRAAAAEPTTDAPADAAPSVTPKRAASTRKTPPKPGSTNRKSEPGSRPATPTTRKKASSPPSGTAS